MNGTNPEVERERARWYFGLLIVELLFSWGWTCERLWYFRGGETESKSAREKGERDLFPMIPY